MTDARSELSKIKARAAEGDRLLRLLTTGETEEEK